MEIFRLFHFAAINNLRSIFPQILILHLISLHQKTCKFHSKPFDGDRCGMLFGFRFCILLVIFRKEEKNRHKLCYRNWFRLRAVGGRNRTSKFLRNEAALIFFFLSLGQYFLRSSFILGGKPTSFVFSPFECINAANWTTSIALSRRYNKAKCFFLFLFYFHTPFIHFLHRFGK